MNLNDIIALAKEGYKPSDIRELIAISEEGFTKDDGKPTKDDGEPTKDDGKPTKDDGEPTKDDGEPTKDNAKSNNDEPDYKSLYEKSQHDLREAQLVNTRQNMANEDAESDEDILNNLVRSFM